MAAEISIRPAKSRQELETVLEVAFRVSGGPLPAVDDLDHTLANDVGCTYLLGYCDGEPAASGVGKVSSLIGKPNSSPNRLPAISDSREAGVARMSLIVLVAGLGLVAAGCGSGEKKSKESELSEKVQAACTGKRLSAAPKLPASFPQIEEDKLVYTQQSTQGPTNVVEGYFKGDVKEAHDEFEKELKGVGFDILFNELEHQDSEISWKGEGRTGQVALREECGDADKTYVHITNRAA